MRSKIGKLYRKINENRSFEKIDKQASQDKKRKNINYQC